MMIRIIIYIHLRPMQSPVQWALGIMSLGVEQLECEAVTYFPLY
jgi:hypothetical protein